MEFLLAHGENNPRNSEGSFAELADGTLLFVWTKYSGTDSRDNSSADLWSMTSSDGGRTWGGQKLFLKRDGLNVMSVSLLRLQDGRLALLYLKKSTVPGWKNYADCRPFICFSSDEAKTWSDPVDVANVPPVWYVVNNDRLIQLKSGRLLIPAAYHRFMDRCLFDLKAITVFFISDDGGLTWREAQECCHPHQSLASGLQEPGVIELADGRVMAWFRTGGGCQYKAFSFDGGEHWTTPEPAPEFLSPVAPLSMKRDPVTGELNAVWVDYHPLRSVAFTHFSDRTPLVLAKSSDEGRTWTGHRILENAPDCGCAYTAMYYHGKDLLLGYCCGRQKTCEHMLQDLKVRLLAPEERN